MNIFLEKITNSFLVFFSLETTKENVLKTFTAVATALLYTRFVSDLTSGFNVQEQWIYRNFPVWFSLFTEMEQREMHETTSMDKRDMSS